MALVETLHPVIYFLLCLILGPAEDGVLRVDMLHAKQGHFATLEFHIKGRTATVKASRGGKAMPPAKVSWTEKGVFKFEAPGEKAMEADLAAVMATVKAWDGLSKLRLNYKKAVLDVTVSGANRYLHEDGADAFFVIRRVSAAEETEEKAKKD